ncbi:Ig-like domain repeat protein [Methanobrevibacter olleyae]|uniref:Adhesin-like protein n=1 Tax=Methanobrevibacter olleyae TaxID=294671 RepID=A0A126R081_METOL|nr:Ig-like domain repeat protein [Methanobrevibacter olleyae]AMK15478.1 adhesin-like protein [Methanobrevibacter olleyae]
MNKKILGFFFILIILFIIININIISASEIDYGTDTISEEILKDDSGINEIKSVENDIGSLETDDKDLKISEDDTSIYNTQTNEIGDSNSTDEESNTSTNKTTLEKTSLDSADYVIKSKYLNVYLKDSSKKAIANQKVKLTIDGKTISETTDDNGIAKFLIRNVAKTYIVDLKFDGDSEYESSTKTLNLRVIAKPIYTKLTIAETGIIKGNYLKVYLKTTAAKVIAKQRVKITINGKTYLKTTNKNGIAKLKLNLNAKIYNLTIQYAGKANYIPSNKKTQINILNRKLIGKTSYGRVDLISVIGNRSSNVRIAYVVGLHSMEHQIHDSFYKLMKDKVNMKYKYYIYKITLTKKTGSYSTLRMRGQKLAKNYIVPHAKKQKYDLVVDIHSTSGIRYKKTYFIHVPKNKHAASMKLAKKTIKTIKSIEKNSKMLYWSPPTQTSPPYIHLPLIKAGTPTFVFETWTYEKKSQTNKRAKILIQSVDQVFS